MGIVHDHTMGVVKRRLLERGAFREKLSEAQDGETAIRLFREIEEWQLRKKFYVREDVFAA